MTRFWIRLLSHSYIHSMSTMCFICSIVSIGHVHVVSGSLMFHTTVLVHVTPNHEHVRYDRNQDIDSICYRISRVSYSSLVSFFLYILIVNCCKFSLMYERAKYGSLMKIYHYSKILLPMIEAFTKSHISKSCSEKISLQDISKWEIYTRVFSQFCKIVENGYRAAAFGCLCCSTNVKIDCS